MTNKGGAYEGQKIPHSPPAAPCQHGRAWQACGVSAQRISELELSENKPSAETVQKIQSGFEAIIAQRGEKLDTLQQEYIACKNSLMERVGEYEYEL